MKYIASCSFGKDSLAMILTILAHDLPLDEVVYCEVMFDETTSGEYPEHAAFIHEKAIPILELCYGLKVQIVKADTNYKEQFYHIRTRGTRAGSPVCFPSIWQPWCNGYLKRKPLEAYRKSQSEDIHEYVGIAADEPKRLARLLEKAGKSAPLADYGITEAAAKDMCREAHLLSPIYDHSVRNGCWMCHNARIANLRALYRHYPALWAELQALQTNAWNNFTARYSVFDLEKRFEQEAAQCTK